MTNGSRFSGRAPKCGHRICTYAAPRVWRVRRFGWRRRGEGLKGPRAGGPAACGPVRAWAGRRSAGSGCRPGRPGFPKPSFGLRLGHIPGIRPPGQKAPLPTLPTQPPQPQARTELKEAPRACRLRVAGNRYMLALSVRRALRISLTAALVRQPQSVVQGSLLPWRSRATQSMGATMSASGESGTFLGRGRHGRRGDAPRGPAGRGAPC